MADAHEGKSHVSIVVAGHVDAGKSSLTGRLLYDLGGINEREMEKLRKIAEENGKPSFAFAYFMDNQKAERERGHSISESDTDLVGDQWTVAEAYLRRRCHALCH